MQRKEFSIEAIETCPFCEMLCLARLPSLLQNAISIMDYTSTAKPRYLQTLTAFILNKLENIYQYAIKQLSKFQNQTRAVLPIPPLIRYRITTIVCQNLKLENN
jgi:hypothetical protein